MAPLCYPPLPPESLLRARLKSERVPLLYKTHLRFARTSPGPSFLPASLSGILPVLKYDRAGGGPESIAVLL